MNVVNAVAPNMPKDRTVAFTQDPGLFFKIDYNKRTLYIPSDRAPPAPPEASRSGKRRARRGKNNSSNPAHRPICCLLARCAL